MRAVLLAAGLGTRLRPVTSTIPKCLVPIEGQPLLDIWLERLTRASIGPFLVNTHYLREQVEAYVQGSRYHDDVTLAYEPVLLGTAGTLLANLDFFQGEDGLLIHADNYCTADFAALRRAHERRAAGCLLTMVTFRADAPRSCGIVEVDGAGVVTSFHEKAAAPPGNLANGAIYVLSKDLIERLAAQVPPPADFSTEILPHLVGRIQTWESDGVLVDIGTVEAYERVIAAGR